MEGGWVILSEIEARIKRKIETVGVPLKNWDIQINYGIKTGFNEAFIIDGKKRAELLEACPEAASIIHPVLRGRDIQKYSINREDLWLIFIPWHFPLHENSSIKGSSKEAETLFKSLYPAVYKHLLNYKSKLESRNQAETGIRYEWYALQRFGSNYWQDFYKPKIIYPNMTKFMPFYLDTEAFLLNDKCFMITGNRLEYLTAFFNSSIFKFCFRENFPELQGGTRELRKIFFDLVSVKQVEEELNNQFAEKIKLIQSYKKQSICTLELEKEIDRMIFNLYDLSEEEREAIGYIEIT